MAESVFLHTAISRLFSAHLHMEVPSVDTDLFETGILDSLGFVELLLQLEREFGVKAPLDDLESDNFRSVRKIAEYVARYGRMPATLQS